jgi:TrmH family RNA methyltransferase
MKIITSAQNQIVKDAFALQQKKYRDEHGLFVVEGEAPSVDAYSRGWDVDVVFVLQDYPLHEVIKTKLSDKLVGVTREILQKISKKDNPQPVITVFKQRYGQLDRIADTDSVVALEDIRDPGNLGTIMRTAHAVGKPYILLVGQCCDPFSPEVIRASMGSFSFAHIISMTADKLLQWKQQQNRPMIGTNVVNAVDYRQADYARSIIVMGNEQKGLSPSLQHACDQCVKIPMPGGTESLNLSVATALLLYQTLS